MKAMLKMAVLLIAEIISMKVMIDNPFEVVGHVATMATIFFGICILISIFKDIPDEEFEL